MSTNEMMPLMMLSATLTQISLTAVWTEAGAPLEAGAAPGCGLSAPS
ncbi:MAG: hypothetical protein WKF79_01675 [Nocardioides sp.]